MSIVLVFFLISCSPCSPYSVLSVRANFLYFASTPNSGSLTDSANSELNCYIVQNGSLQPIAQAISMQTTSDTSAKSTRVQTPVTKSLSQSNDSETGSNVAEPPKAAKRKEAHSREGNTTPLDLSVRRSSMDRSYRERSASISSSVSGDLQRLNTDTLHDGKENLLLNSSNSVSPEQIVCAPSLPGSPSTTPSPKRHSPRSSSSPRGVLTISPSTLSSLHLNQANSQAPAILRPLLASELAARLPDASSAVAAAVLAGTPAQHLLDGAGLELALGTLALPALTKATSPIAMAANNVAAKKPLPNNSITSRAHAYVKQGVSKCKECNIVFVKYETYLAHKNHYCSASVSADGKTKPSPPTSPLANSSTGSSTTNVVGSYRQLICAACGIKFTTLDNLQAHQTYYCPKRIELPTVSGNSGNRLFEWFVLRLDLRISILLLFQVIREKCAKCKTMHEVSQPCPTNQNHYKCPICDVVSNSAAESRRHIETHAGVKAFRCSICRYKGNTLR